LNTPKPSFVKRHLNPHLQKPSLLLNSKINLLNHSPLLLHSTYYIHKLPLFHRYPTLIYLLHTLNCPNFYLNFIKCKSDFLYYLNLYYQSSYKQVLLSLYYPFKYLLLYKLPTVSTPTLNLDKALFFIYKKKKEF
jgi:hypothetical protein